jgi:hypothetical protein
MKFRQVPTGVIYMATTIFTVDVAFIITGRGLVLAGVANGEIERGYRIMIEVNGKFFHRIISGIEFARVGNGEMMCLMIKCESEAVQKEIRDSHINGKDFPVYCNSFDGAMIDDNPQ